MKKTLIYALALALALSLTACGQPKAEQPTDPAPGTSTPEPIAAPEPIKDTTPKTTEDAQSPEDGQALEELNHDELIAIFEENYEISKSIYNSDDEEVIRSELEMIKIIVKSMDKSLPSDYETQYRAWRPSVNQQTQQASEVVLTFTDCNETVYATGTVNLRSGPSTNDEKVGALNKNQSVTRIGVGTGDYANWSKVRLSDGSEVYVASKYLTTTKPVSPSNSKPSGGTSSTGGSQQPAGSSQGSNHAHSAEDDDPILSKISGDLGKEWNPYEGLTPEEKEAAIKANQEATQKIVDGITGSFG